MKNYEVWCDNEEIPAYVLVEVTGGRKCSLHKNKEYTCVYFFNSTTSAKADIAFEAFLNGLE